MEKLQVDFNSYQFVLLVFLQKFIQIGT